MDRGEPIGLVSSRHWCVCLLYESVRLCIHASTLSYMNISDNRWLNKSKFHLENHWGGKLATIGLGPDQIRTLVSIVTYSSHRVISRKIFWQLRLVNFLTHLSRNDNVSFGDRSLSIVRRRRRPSSSVNN